MMDAEKQLAWQIIETTNTNLFLTGKAGTGKTTFLRDLKRNSSKRMVVVAPTGIAAINAEGVTMHSFFQLPFAPYLPDSKFCQQGGQYRFGKEKLKIMRAIDLLVIDEISMVRADMLDAVDDVLRRNRRNGLPFGGVQLVMIGDLGQLSPVAKDEEWRVLGRYYATPYFFSSRALSQSDYAVVEFTHVYRQSDSVFLSLLNSVRDNTADASVLAKLNSRYIPDFKPSSAAGYIRLTTHNAQAARVNSEELAKLPGRAYTFDARIEGKFPDYMFPTDNRLVLKSGAQVMFVKNDSSPEKRYYNGMIGTVDEIDETGLTVVAKDTGEIIVVEPEEWTNSRYVVDEDNKEITEEVEGTFRQMPVKAAWAITIHKSQGLTFEHAIIDASSSFAHGQTYVALSRCKSLEGMVLSAPLPPSAIIRDSAIDDYARDARTHIPDGEGLRRMQRSFFLVVVGELFDFSSIAGCFFTMMRIISEHLVRSYPKLSMEYKARNAMLSSKVSDVAAKFRMQYEHLAASTPSPDTDELLQERIVKAAAYFKRELSDVEAFVKRATVKTDNKEIARRLDDTWSVLMTDLSQKLLLLDYVRQHGFTVSGYLRRKCEITLGSRDDKTDRRTAPSSRRRKRVTASATVPGQPSSTSSARTAVGRGSRLSAPVAESAGDDLSGQRRQDVVEALTRWRRQKAVSLGIPAYCIMWQKSLLAIADTMPASESELAAIPAFGHARAGKYSAEILELLAPYRE